ncbi:MAG: class I SAM-dependent methyltransferase [archaeon]
MMKPSGYPILDEKEILYPGDTARVIREAGEVWTMHHTNPACYGWFILHNPSSLPDVINGHPAPIILDVGCSLGNSTDNLKYFFPNKRVIGIDISEEHIKTARKNYFNCEFMVGNGLCMDELELTDPVAAIFAYNSIGILADVYPNSLIGEVFMKSALKTLANNGLVAVLGDYVDWFIAQKRNNLFTLVDSELAFDWRKSVTYRRFGAALNVTENGLRLVGRPETQGDKFFCLI